MLRNINGLSCKRKTKNSGFFESMQDLLQFFSKAMQLMTLRHSECNLLQSIRKMSATTANRADNVINLSG